jgi:8-oxo-dGTP pyrophosphatase MutT (NUDIX family)
MTKAEIDSLEQEYIAKGFELAVDLFILNSEGKLLCQKRSANRRLYPNCWDFPGGHVDPGDNLYNTIFKEVLEETGLVVTDVKTLIEVSEWTVPAQSVRPGESPKKVIFKFVVDVESTENPVLETGKAVEFRWIDLSNIEILKENRYDGDFYVYNSAKKVLETL